VPNLSADWGTFEIVTSNLCANISRRALRAHLPNAFMHDQAQWWYIWPLRFSALFTWRMRVFTVECLEQMHINM
jgi:hypothetical protein